MKNSEIIDLTPRMIEDIVSGLKIKESDIILSDKAKEGFPDAYAVKTNEITKENSLYIIEHMRVDSTGTSKKGSPKQQTIRKVIDDWNKINRELANCGFFEPVPATEFFSKQHCEDHNLTERDMIFPMGPTLDLSKYNGSFEKLWESCVCIINKHYEKIDQYKRKVVEELGYTPDCLRIIFVVEVNDEAGIMLVDGKRYNPEQYLQEQLESNKKDKCVKFLVYQNGFMSYERSLHLKNS